MIRLRKIGLKDNFVSVVRVFNNVHRDLNYCHVRQTEKILRVKNMIQDTIIEETGEARNVFYWHTD